MAMRNIKIVIMYDGSGYGGWQRLGKLDKKPSIQNTLEELFSNYFGENIKLIGSGRTDAGTHAYGQVANFHCHSKQPADKMKKELNILLPEDIAILEICDEAAEFHSRYSAKVKTYRYRIDQDETQSVFSRKYTYHMPKPLNLDNMAKASALLTGTHDFKAFSTDRKDKKSTIRTIESIKIHRHDKELWIDITGDGFLYNMARIIVGTLLEVGEGTRQPEEISAILASRDRRMAGLTVSSQGLFLYNVRY